MLVFVEARQTLKSTIRLYWMKIMNLYVYSCGLLVWCKYQSWLSGWKKKVMKRIGQSDYIRLTRDSWMLRWIINWTSTKLVKYEWNTTNLSFIYSGNIWWMFTMKGFIYNNFCPIFCMPIQLIYKLIEGNS